MGTSTPCRKRRWRDGRAGCALASSVSQATCGWNDRISWSKVEPLRPTLTTTMGRSDAFSITAPIGNAAEVSSDFPFLFRDPGSLRERSKMRARAGGIVAASVSGGRVVLARLLKRRIPTASCIHFQTARAFRRISP